jgi:hypothetical protein
LALILAASALKFGVVQDGRIIRHGLVVPTRQDGEVGLLIEVNRRRNSQAQARSTPRFRRSALGVGHALASKGSRIYPSESQESQSQDSAGPAKVMAVDRESNGEREQGRTAESGPEQQTPVLETLATKDAETEVGSKKRHEIRPVQRAGEFRRLVFAQKRADPLVIGSGRIKVSHESLVTFAQRFSVHPRNEVRCSIQVVLHQRLNVEGRLVGQTTGAVPAQAPGTRKELARTPTTLFQNV